MKTTFRSVLCVPAACAVLLALSACGNKGPLVMPQKPVPVEEQAVEPMPEPAQMQGEEGASAPVDSGDAVDG